MRLLRWVLGRRLRAGASGPVETGKRQNRCGAGRPEQGPAVCCVSSGQRNDCHGGLRGSGRIRCKLPARLTERLTLAEREAGGGGDRDDQGWMAAIGEDAVLDSELPVVSGPGAGHKVLQRARIRNALDLACNDEVQPFSSGRCTRSSGCLRGLRRG